MSARFVVPSGGVFGAEVGGCCRGRGRACGDWTRCGHATGCVETDGCDAWVAGRASLLAVPVMLQGNPVLGSRRTS